MAEFSSVMSELKAQNQKTIEALQKELTKIRAGKASVQLLDGIKVSAYGQASPFNQIASLSTPDARTIVIAPWDKSILGEIEKAINQSDLGLNPQSDGKVVRLNIPALTEERRKDLVKLVNKFGEEAKVSSRQHRKVANESVKAMEKSKECSEDDSKRYQDEIQKETDQCVSQIDQILEKKTKDVMSI
ncbi:MAG: ribosome recycling factor [Bradymonadales bacterium]|nr:MAG: ribosome recycling factor [Bradymonadales bacterium]